MLTKDQRENLIDRTVEDVTAASSFDDYIDVWCETNFGDHHTIEELLEEAESGLESMFFENYFADDLGTTLESLSDEELIQTAIDEGVIDSLESYLAECAEAEAEYNREFPEGSPNILNEGTILSKPERELLLNALVGHVTEESTPSNWIRYYANTRGIDYPTLMMTYRDHSLNIMRVKDFYHDGKLYLYGELDDAELVKEALEKGAITSLEEFRTENEEELEDKETWQRIIDSGTTYTQEWNK